MGCLLAEGGKIPSAGAVSANAKPSKLAKAPSQKNDSAAVAVTEAKNKVELFRHLPQYERGTQLPDLMTKFFELDPMHPAVYKLYVKVQDL
ncbi:NagB/RpiA/CoA transferase-like superfamily protein [Euphorbia peplus]|nr:NagB/RpiA/CoA transferase-like superfamily protein [Euphorbia peplus]